MKNLSHVARVIDSRSDKPERIFSLIQLMSEFTKRTGCSLPAFYFKGYDTSDFNNFKGYKTIDT